VRGATRPSIALSALVLSTVAGLVYAFARWTATSAWSFPAFLSVAFVLVYLPGRLLVLLIKVPASRIERLTLSLALGIPLSSAVYWMCARTGVPRLLWGWMLLVVLVSAHPRLRPRRARAPGLDVRYGHSLLVLAVIVAILPFAFTPLYFQNLALQPDGGMTFSPLPDVMVHVALASELTHRVPPLNPFLAGHAVSYHYGMHTLAAAFATCGLSVQDLVVRYLPVLFMAMTVGAGFILARTLLGSEAWAAVAAVLVVLGEDLSWVPGMLLGNREIWSVYFFGLPAIASLYLLNPMLPALGLLLAALFCVERFVGTEQRPWLVAGVLLGAGCLPFKVFAATQLLAAMALAGALYAILFGRWAMAQGAACLAVIVVPLLLFFSSGNQVMEVRLDPWPYVSRAVFRVGAGETLAGGLYRGDLGLPSLLAYWGLALPVFLLGVFGARAAGLAVWARSLWSPAPHGAFRCLIALFVLMGPPLSLSLAITPTGQGHQFYNNAVWFLVQSKYLMWFLALLPLCGLQGARAFAAAAVVLVLSLPSTLQMFAMQAQAAPVVLERSLVETLAVLDREARPGDVCLAREPIAQAILVTTRCHSPTLGVFPESYLSASDRQALERMRDGFWSSWDALTDGGVGAIAPGAEWPSVTGALSKLRADYIVDWAPRDGRAVLLPGREIAFSGFTLKERFRNEAYVILSVVRAPPTGPK
jgi:hypothetical protein